MKIERIGLLLIFVSFAFAGLLIYQQREDLDTMHSEVLALNAQVRDLGEEVAALRTGVANEATAREASVQALGDEIAGLGILPTESEVADALVSKHLSALVSAQKEMLLSDSVSVERLRGVPGAPADPAAVAAAMLDSELPNLVSQVSDGIVVRFGERAFYNAPLIAAVAERVHARYGFALQPPAASAVDIAAELAVSDVFSSLVAHHLSVNGTADE